MEGAFFDLDKTVIATSSVLAFGRPLYRRGLLSRSALLRSVYGQPSTGSGALVRPG